MHYGESLHKKREKLTIVIYKSDVLGPKSKLAAKKDGTLKRSAVHYDLMSIQKCQFFPPVLLGKLIADPYNYVNERLSDEKFEAWYEIQCTSDGQGLVIHNVQCLYDFSNKMKFLH